MDAEGLGTVVVGGANGVGEATVRHFASLGADITILDIDGRKAAQVAADIYGYSQICDVTEAESVATGITSAMARFGQAPRIVVNCAGFDVDARILGPEGKVSTPIFRRSIEVNLMGVYHVMTYAAQGMMDLPPLENDECGVIINTVVSPQRGDHAGQSAKYAAQSGAAALCEVAAQEFRDMNIRVLTIALNAGAADAAYLRLLSKIVADPSLSGQTLVPAPLSSTKGD